MNMDLFVPITFENIYALKPGEWIWDDKEVEKRVHRRTLGGETLMEPIGFRQIHVLDLKDFGTIFNSKPFMLSHYDHANDWRHGGAHWEYFEEGRFYMFKSKQTRVAYVCDQRYCPDGCHNPDCHHTEDITHAKNFTKLEAGKWMEKFEEE